MKVAIVAILALSALSMPQSTIAQSEYGGGWAVPTLDTSISITNDVINREITNKIVRDEIAAKNRGSPSIFTGNPKKSLQSAPVASSQQRLSLNFRPSLVRRKQNLAQFVNKTRADNPEGAAQMAKLFATTDVIGVIGQGIAPFGLRVDNVADAYTVYWTNAWLGSRGRSDTLSQQQLDAVKNQAANALLAIPAFISASDAQKQEMAEAMLVQAAMIEAYIGNAKSDPELMSKVKAAIAKGGKGMGLDLYAMNLTPNGFVLGKRGSVVDDIDMVPGNESNDQALASATPSSDKEVPNYALIAAAGGAGLGGMFLLGKVMGRKR